MALSVNDIIEVVDYQTYLSEIMLNVYHYQVVSKESLADLGDVSSAFVLGVMEEVEAIQSTSVTHAVLKLRNLTNGLDILESTLSGHVGEATGTEGLPSLIAASYRLVRSTAATRHGSKRIGGLVEGDLAGNVLASGAVTRYNTVATVLGGHITVTGTVDHDIDLRPVIIGRVPTGEPGAGELDLSVINPVLSAQYIRVTSQTTRRAGRGS